MYMNIQTKQVLNLLNIENLKANKMLKVKPELFIHWDFKKNKDIDIFNITKGTAKKVWWLCEKCHSSYDMSVDKKISQKAKCPYCRGLRVNETNSLESLRPEIAKFWDYDKNPPDKTPSTVTNGSKYKAFWKCPECKYESQSTVYGKKGCASCSGQVVIKGVNDIHTTNPQMGLLFENYDDGYIFMENSNLQARFRCAKCELTIERVISDVNNRGFHCPICSIKFSFGERVMYELLSKNNIVFEREKVFLWMPSKRYDFYLPELKCIIEIHGEQHRKRTFSSIGRTVEKEQENDILKEKMAIENNILHYINIAVDSYDLTGMKKEIENNGLLNILGLSKEKLDDISLFSNIDITQKIWDLWNNNNISIKDISKKVTIGEQTVRKYLRLGKELGKCSYDK